MLQSVVLILLIPAVNRVEGGGGRRRGETLSSEETDRVYSPVQTSAVENSDWRLCSALLGPTKSDERRSDLARR